MNELVSTPIPSDEQLDSITDRHLPAVLSRLSFRPRRRSVTIAATSVALVGMFGIGLVVGGATLARPADPVPGPDPRGPVMLTYPKDDYNGPIPAFAGPWAAAFTAAYRSTSDVLDHQILAKGVILPADFTAISRRYEACMKVHGVRATVDGPAGQLTTDADPHGPRARKADIACSPAFYAVAMLNGQVTRNPQNLNENEIMSACFVREELVPPTYDAAAYAAELLTQKFSFNIDSGMALKCMNSPIAEK